MSLMPVSRSGVLGVDNCGRKAAVRGAEVSRGRSTSRDRVDGWEGPNAKPSVRTFVLVAVVMTAANPIVGLAGRV